MALMCKVMFCGVGWNNSAISACVTQTVPQNITLHIKAIYAERELLAEATCKEHLQVREEGKRQVKRALKHYNLDVVLAVRSRVHSHRGTQFRPGSNGRQVRERAAVYSH